MDKINKYRRVVKNILEEQASYKASTGYIDDYAVCDENTDNYLLINVGWHSSGRRQQGMPIHIRIKNEKVWVEWDGTDQQIVQQLIDNGIPEDDIVLGFEKPVEFANKDLIAA